MSASVSRRAMLTTTGGFAVAFVLPGCAHHHESARIAARSKASGTFVPNAWITVTPEDTVLFTLDRVEMGQGTTTSHAMLVAEELEVDVASIRIEAAGASRVYDNPEIGHQVTGGSTSVKGSWKPLREAASVARQMLVSAAATSWGVSPEECSAVNGEVVHAKSGKKARYGSLVALAATQPVPKAKTKAPKDWKLVGKSLGRLDARAKVDGSLVYGIDVKIDGMLTAVVVRSPITGGTLASWDGADAKASPGVRHVVAVPSGIAVVADSYWQARLAAEKVKATFVPGKHGAFDTETIRTRQLELAKKSGKLARREGDTLRVLAASKKTVEAVYEAPHLAHATMEPMNATVRIHDGTCEVWAPTQAPGLAHEAAMKASGLPAGKVVVHTTALGGGFGRRLNQDFVVEAVEIAKAVKVPVKVVWSREDDMANDCYRPRMVHAMKGSIADDGTPDAWFHRVVGPSIVAHVATEWVAAMSPDWLPGFVRGFMGKAAARAVSKDVILDETLVEGAVDHPYGVANVQIEFHDDDPKVPIGFWRGVGHSHSAFAVESFVDELAHAAGKDPYTFRRKLLERSPRHRAVLDLAASKAEWGKPLPKGMGRGIALSKSFGSYAAHVAEVSVTNGKLRVHRVVVAVDCGTVVNPDIVAAQVEGAVAFGLSAALKQRVTFEKGRVAESNFHQYKSLRMHEMPDVVVHVVPSTEPPTGIGEPGLPPIAPAVANAIFAATGRRIRSLPLEPQLAAST
ncbi:MAG: xanthine dehydrogenase family protein molybdopterin-binding subunit [Polyangiaceae bacterium]